MRIRVVMIATVLTLTMSACGDGAAQPSPEPTATVATTPAPSQPAPSPESAAPQSSADLELAPGRVGPVTAGMSKDAAVATGLFDADVDQVCETPRLTWKKAFTGVDVLTDDTGVITSLGVSDSSGPRTADDKGVGSTFGELIETYGGDLSAPEVAGFGQVGVFVRDGDNWLGFLFADATSVEQVDNDPGFTVSFAEATKFTKPGLVRDGC